MLLAKPMLKLLYQDEHIVVVHKPSGLLVHRSNIDRHETAFLIQQLRDQIGQQVFPVHRLDKPTSGLMVLALHKTAARELSNSFIEKQVSKAYIAIVRGYVSDQIIDYPLKEEQDKMTDRLADKNKAAQSAISELQLLAQAELPFPLGKHNSARFSKVKLIPQTGRKHQLRRHMAHIRHPIIGDTTHGDGKQNRYAREHFGLARLALLASELAFVHPESGLSMSFTTQADDDLASAFGVFESAFLTKSV